ncbi:MAG TPA: FadR/GntR family transcriptional regulator [Alphaproteobacteria bacterium]|nr:FadR/GntR family transcriptional regulator [Alphaproteobacteria bacterium]
MEQHRRSLSEEAYDRLRELLASQAFPPNARLPSEAELARRFLVSRPVLRQALARLRAEGHVYSRKGSGTYVREIAKPPLVSFGPLHSIPDVQSFLEFRCSVEGEMTALAARRADAQAIAEVKQARKRVEAEFASGQSGLDADVLFHLAIARASGNRFFVATLEALTEQIKFGIRLTRELSDRPSAERFAEVCREHARISAALESGDADAARQAMTDHLRGGIRRLFGQ